MVRVRSRIEIIGVNPYVLLEGEQVSSIKAGWHGPMPVRFQITGAESDALWRVNLMPTRGGASRLYINGVIRRATGVEAGDVVTIDVLFDDEYRKGPIHPMPAWFGDGLSKNPTARRGWERLSPSRRKEILRYFARLKSTEAKERNLSKALCVLAGGRGRFMGRSWNEESTADL